MGVSYFARPERGCLKKALVTRLTLVCTVPGIYYGAPNALLILFLGCKKNLAVTSLNFLVPHFHVIDWYLLFSKNLFGFGNIKFPRMLDILVLHCIAHLRRLVQAPKYWTATQFTLRDIWKVDLRDVDVVAVYGLTPIMKPLGLKLREELAPGSIVLSNVFSIPGWRPESTSSHGTHIYVVPEPEVSELDLKEKDLEEEQVKQN